ncbi:FtsK/SpoIIIE domain-containing protein [Microbacterium paraoxydans]|uniref:FtsK/SpoIIIE domain-containing protein n=1 Tax=Microbacterium paraoxydans TaxID=199592 RepID=UPI001CFA285E|nr:FtsK/SpoIIIE domain-containing protein [Microbacterium paraoxydans]
MNSLPIVLPAAAPPSRRAPLPFLAAAVPVIGGVLLWVITGSVFALCFAALGPLMMGASFLDAARTRRRERRRAEADAERDWAVAEGELIRRHRAERDALWLRLPDASVCLTQPPLRGAEPPDAETSLVVGAGSVASGVGCSGGDDSRSRDFRRRSGLLEDAPTVVPLGGGVCIRGARPVILAVARALVVQLGLRFSAAQLSLVGTALDECGLDAMPHARRSRRSGFRLGVGTHESGRVDADSLIWLTPADAEVPEGITTVIDVVEPGQARLRTPNGTSTLAVECLSFAQAAQVAEEHAALGDGAEVLPEVLSLHELEQPPLGEGLAAVVGRSAYGDVMIDIVEDGPHAIVTGTTGTGKSELLVSWVTALAAHHGPDRVTFLLADFKGGTAFEPLRALRQVAAVITDLDDEGARRGVSSLTAELRRREALLAAAGARDVRDVGIPRLVIVVDEFAALLAEHPDLGAVFIDVAARGRALGMHLILGTQRATGVVRDALAANCPLRLSLRVADAADSRAMIGTDAAAELPGGAASRGVGLVRRPADSEPIAMRVALTGAAELRGIGVRWAEAAPPRSPWLPALPSCLPLGDLLRAPDHAPGDALILGRADEPAQQVQPLETLRCGQERGLVLLGAPGSGRTTALRVLAAQRSDSDTVWVPRDLEAAWDLIDIWTCGNERVPSLVLCDDLDTLVSDFPPEYGQQFAHRWERLLRAGSGTTFVVTAGRSTGALGRVLDTLPRRALLRTATRVEHLAAGGEAAAFLRDRGPGRASIGDREVQLAWLDDAVGEPIYPRSQATWSPSCPVTAIVSAGARATAARLRDAHAGFEVVLVGAEPTLSDSNRILVADAETWQRNWSSWQRIRAEGEVVIRAEQQADLRQLAGVRELPPYARAHAGRAWTVRGAESPRRAILSELMP